MLSGVGVTSGMAQSTTPTPTSSPASSTTPLVSVGGDRYQEAMEALGRGDKARAESLLQEVVKQSPMHAGAWLDLALLYCDMGQAARAQDVFTKIEQELEAPAGIRVLIAQARARGCQAPRAWLGQAQVSIGRASNVNYAPMDAVIRFAPNAPFSELVLGSSNRPKANWFGVAEIMVVLPASVDNWAGAQWQGLVQGKRYHSEHDFDTVIVAGGASWRGTQSDPPRLSAWGVHTWESSVYLSHWQMGGQAYETSAHLWGGTWSNELQLARGNWRWGWEGGVSHYDYPQSNAYNALRWDGRLRAQLRQSWSGKQHSWTGSVGPVVDWALQGRPGGDRLGYTLSGQWEAIWAPEHETVVFAQQQNVQESRAYNSAFFGEQQRSPKSGQWGLRYTHRISRTEAWVVQALSQRVSDRINLFSYKNQSLTIGYQLGF